MRRRLLDWLGFPARFRARDFQDRERLRGDYTLLARALERHLEFDSLLDVGCANGFLVEEIARTGRHTAGIEKSSEVHDVLPDDLRDRVAVGDFTEAEGEWDLVTCVEVAEHIPPQRSEALVDTLAERARDWIYFTAAPPGQRGRGHINCRPHREWIDWFRKRGWELEPARTEAVRRDLEALEKAVWLRDNSFVMIPAAGRSD